MARYAGDALDLKHAHDGDELLRSPTGNGIPANSKATRQRGRSAIRTDDAFDDVHDGDSIGKECNLMLPFLSINSSGDFRQGALHNAHMNTFGERLIWALKRADRNQSDLARAVGLSRNSISQWVTGRTEPAAASLRKAALYLQVDIHWLATGEGERTDMARMTPTESSVDADIGRGAPGTVLEIDVRAGAGGGGVPAEAWVRDANGNTYAAEGVRDEWTLPATIMREMLHATPKHIRAFEVVGDSMEPRLMSGDRAFIDLRKTNPHPEGIFALWDGYGVVIKRLQIVRGSDPMRVKIISDNPRYDAYEATMDEIRIIGRIAGRFTTM